MLFVSAWIAIVLMTDICGWIDVYSHLYVCVCVCVFVCMFSVCVCVCVCDYIF